MEVVCATHFKLYPTANYQTLQPGETLEFEIICKGSIIKETNTPKGGYIVWLDENGKETGDPVSVDIEITPFAESLWHSTRYPYGNLIYEQNEQLAFDGELRETDIFPAPKFVNIEEGEYKGDILADAQYRIDPVAAEHYQMSGVYSIDIMDTGVFVFGTDSAGLFYGKKTLEAIARNYKRSGAPIPYIHVSDYPDFPYRGLMLDVSRNFIKKDDVLKLLDILSSYKINKFHFHLGDDEGWRVEIPGLPELTEVGAKRGHTHNESECLFPAYGSGWNANDPNSSGNGFYSVQDFIEILQYAKERYIEIIPEFDMPGHSRAAIKSMNARYNRYKDSDLAKAEEFLLTNFSDTSRYYSAQAYTDNVLDVSMPSVYRFTFKVIDEIEKMYEAAGLKMKIWNLGGDEVPRGSWKGSSYCQDLAKELGYDDINYLEDYFIGRVLDYLARKNIQMMGWHELSILPNGEPNPDFAPYKILNLCWHNTGNDRNGIQGKLLEAGFPVILANVDYLYLDMAYNRHQSEPGLTWGGYVDEFRTLAFEPNVFVPVGARNVAGMQAQLWGETITNFDDACRFIFPKIYGVIERAWNTESKLSNDIYNQRIQQWELPYLQEQGVNFRIAQPGIKIEDGMLYANSQIAEAAIYYTLDGTVPTEKSTRWTVPIPCDATKVNAKSFFQGKESVVSTWIPNP